MHATDRSAQGHATAAELRLNILLVDDDPDFLESLRIPLEAAGHTVTTADGVKAARAAFDQQVPDIALIDLMMEDADGGFTLCHAFKAKAPQLPVIIISAVTSETGLDFDAATPEERAWIKADAFLAKPIRFEQLEREILRHVQNVRS
ncbi:MAG TPA: response regulator [Phycisphaerae bacterium]|nr:response regulator [Phycisphaerales bacterium]HRX87789.1 response regulator [Phycisphaerae bacterium]